MRGLTRGRSTTLLNLTEERLIEDRDRVSLAAPPPLPHHCAYGSVFRKEDGKVVRVADAEFGPGDDFCAVWQLFDLIPEGPDNWQPKYKY